MVFFKFLKGRKGKNNQTNSNRRLNFRIEPTHNTDLSVSLRGIKATIVDIAVGGVCISTSQDIFLRNSDAVTLIINIDNEQFRILSKVIRAWFAESKYFTSIQFIKDSASWDSLLEEKIAGNSKSWESLLGKKIIFWERERLLK
jgi:hypothetical protein